VGKRRKFPTGQKRELAETGKKTLLLRVSHSQSQSSKFLMMKTHKPILYIKNECPWCIKALNFFNVHGVDLDVRDVNKDNSAMQRMLEISDQTKCPTFEFGDFVVADFSVDEFLDALDHEPDIRRQLGLGEDDL
jgi:glutaredoxin